MQDTKKPILALTSSGVEQVRPVDAEKLDQLATWLCKEEENACMHWWDSHYTEVDRRDRDYEEQQEANGGYCNHCRDFAAELLVKSPLADMAVAA